MLYVTTKSINDVYTANRTLCADKALDGGLFIPYRMPAFSKTDLDTVLGGSFNETVANVLNQFFPVHLSGWDIAFAVGKFAKISSLGQKIVIAELWHNHDADFASTEKKLFALIGGAENKSPSQWFGIVIQIAVLFGVYGELVRGDLLVRGQKLDVSVNIGNTAEVAAVLYAKQIGLPVGSVIYACDENSIVWEFFRRGSINMSTLASVEQNVADLLERIVYSLLGQDEALRFRTLLDNGGVYRVSAEHLELLTDEMFAAAVGKTRLDSVIRSVKRTDNYQISTYTARSLGGLQDFRASIGESRTALLFSVQAD